MQAAPLSSEGEKDASKAFIKRRVDNLRKLYRTVQPAINPPKRHSRASTNKKLRDLTKSSMIVPRTRLIPSSNRDDQISECSRSFKVRKRSSRNVPSHERPISKEEQEDTTVFENDVKSAAKVVEKPVRLRWKKGYEPDDVEISVEGLEDLTICEVSVIEHSADYRCACKILAQTPTEMAESLLSDDENRKIRYLFKRFDRHKPSRDLVRLLQKAMRSLLGRSLADGRITIDDEMKAFLTSPRCDAHLLDMVLLVPEFMPDCWGGEKSSKVIHVDGDAANKAVQNLRSNMRSAHSPEDSAESVSQAIPMKLPFGQSGIWSMQLGQLEQKALAQRNGRHRESRESLSKELTDTISQHGKRCSRKKKTKGSAEILTDEPSKEEGSDGGAANKKTTKIPIRTRRTKQMPRSGSSDERSEVSCETESTNEKNDEENDKTTLGQKHRKPKTSRKKTEAKMRRARSSLSNSKDDDEVKREVTKLQFRDGFDQPVNNPKSTIKLRGTQKNELSRSRNNSKEESSSETPTKEIEKRHLRSDGYGLADNKAKSRLSKLENVKTKSNSKEDLSSETLKRDAAKSPGIEAVLVLPMTNSNTGIEKKGCSSEEMSRKQPDDADMPEAKQ